MPPPITTTSRPTGSFERSVRLAQLGNEIHRIADALQLLARSPQRIHPRKADPKEDRVILGLQLVKRDIAAKLDPGPDLDPADFQQPFDLAGGEVVHRLVARNPVFVEPASLRAALQYHDIMAMHRQPVRASQAQQVPPPRPPPACRSGPRG